MCKFWPFKLLSNDRFLNWRQRNKDKSLTGTLNYLQRFAVSVLFNKVYFMIIYFPKESENET